MTIEPDPVNDVRAELARIEPPNARELDVQRGRLDNAIAHATEPQHVARRRARRLLPASGLAIAGVAAVAFLVFALQPDRGGNSSNDDSSRKGLRLATGTPDGAFAGLNLDSASAAEILRAAGRAAADGTPDAGPNDWAFTRMESGSGEFPTTTMERWTSPDGERSFAVSTVTITDPDHGNVGRSVSLHYEHLKREILGDVSWMEQADGTYERRANWSDDANDGSGDIARMVRLTDLLRTTHTADDVQRALDDSIEGAELRFQNGFACGTDPKYSSCSGSGLLPQAQGLSDAESRRLYLTGQLLTVMIGNVFPSDATRAIYDYLAALPEATVAPADDGSGEVILSLRVKGPSFTTHRLEDDGNPGVGFETRPVPGSTFNTKAVAVIDPSTGRLVELNPNPTMGDFTARYLDFGVASGPVVGSTICADFPQPCKEARQFERRRAKDPEATFSGVVDWMFISQFCDGVINRDGSPNPNGGRTPDSYKDPKANAERRACEKREAAAAQGG